MAQSPYSSGLDQEEEYAALSFDPTGSVTQTSVIKAELLGGGGSGGGAGVHMRDLLQLGLDVPFHDRHSNRMPPCILPRADCVLVLIGPFKAIIRSDTALFFDADRAMVRGALDRLSGMLRLRHLEMTTASAMRERGNNGGGVGGASISIHSPQAFELLVIEHLLSELCDSYSRRLKLFQPVVSQLLAAMAEGYEAGAMEGLHRLVPVKNGISNFEMVTSEALECIAELLKNDEDMVGLLLTEREDRLRQGETVALSKHAMVELMLENYHRRLMLVRQSIKHLQSRIKSSQEMTALHIDINRNRIIHTNLHLTMAGVSLAAMTTVAGFYGMNLDIPVALGAGNPHAFSAVTVGCAFLGGSWYGLSVAYANGWVRRDKRKRMADVNALQRIFENMGSIDHTVNSLIRHDGDKMCKAEFAAALTKEIGETSREVSEREVDLIFEIFDPDHDGDIAYEELRDVTGGRKRRDRAWDAKRAREIDVRSAPTPMDERTLHPSRWFPEVK